MDRVREIRAPILGDGRHWINWINPSLITVGTRVPVGVAVGFHELLIVAVGPFVKGPNLPVLAVACVSASDRLTPQSILEVHFGHPLSPEPTLDG